VVITAVRRSRHARTQALRPSCPEPQRQARKLTVVSTERTLSTLPETTNTCVRPGNARFIASLAGSAFRVSRQPRPTRDIQLSQLRTSAQDACCHNLLRYGETTSSFAMTPFVLLSVQCLPISTTLVSIANLNSSSNEFFFDDILSV
jgi:hypothetical protein